MTENVTKIDNNLSQKFDGSDNTLLALKSLEAPCHAEELLLSYVPQAPKHIVQFSGVGVTRAGYLTTIVGAQGSGKSNTTEAIVSSFLNPYVDTLGFRVETDGSLLWIDGERTRDDIAFGFQRIKKRISIENNPDLITEDRFRNVHCYPLITHPSRDFRLQELERLCELIRPKLLLLDGGADFVIDVNHTESCVNFVSRLTALANKYGTAVITSIHPNPDQKADHKPRGVLGSELIRTSESMILLKRAPDDRDTRILTTLFAHGKNRSENDNLEHYFRWDHNQKMFLSCSYTPTVKPGKVDEMAKAFEEVLNDKKLSYGDLASTLVSTRGVSQSTAERWIKKATSTEMIFNVNGLYGLSPF